MINLIPLLDVRAKGATEASGVLVSRRLEYQLQLVSFSLNKIPTEVGTLNAFSQSKESEPLPLKLTHDLIANVSNEESLPETKND
jgi:hypothetical protein